MRGRGMNRASSGGRGTSGRAAASPRDIGSANNRAESRPTPGNRPNGKQLSSSSRGRIADSVNSSSAETASSAGPPTGRSRHVVTTLTQSGTELPKKLNTKVFIDGLPYENNGKSGSPSVEEELMQFVVAWKVGKPLRLIKKDGQGFGFLVFQSPHSVDVAVRVLNGRKFLGRALRVEVPKPRDMGDAAGINGGGDLGKGNYARQVLLSDLAKVSQPEIIREILRDVAPQLEKRLESIKMTSKNRKAFLTFVSPEDVESAVLFLNGLSMFGRRVSAAPAAAPGSLPYSKVPMRGVAHGGDDATAESGKGLNATHSARMSDHPGQGEEEEEEEDLVVPLGVDIPPGNRPAKNTGKKGAASPSAAKATSLPSNVTGVTEKYNLLDDGPAEVFVGNLGEDVTEGQLRAHFSSCGKINSCKIIVDRNTMLPTGIATIVFALPAYAAYAKEHMHGSRLRGHIIRVDRGDEASAPLASELSPCDDDDTVDEDAYMKHIGITNKSEYFKGTSFEEKPINGRKRTREGVAAVGKPKGSGKKNKGEGLQGDFAKESGKRVQISGDDSDDDDEEHFYDVDEGDKPLVRPSGGRRGVKERAKSFPNPARRVPRGKKHIQ
uniref:Putative RNA-binding protein n=1 Tax=Trypanosoma congolense (strain IL3000) TaxID=1068625 RepID=G0UKA0_TRYCI|nr:putative RNA-binding protein [Trypanosoma congolense IL3000]